MTSPFDWKNKPSTIAQELERNAEKSRASSRGAVAGLSPKLHLSGKPDVRNIDPRRFHVYSKATPKGK